MGEQQIMQMGQALQQRDQQLQKMQADLVSARLALDAEKVNAASDQQANQIKAMEANIKAQSVTIEQYAAETERLRVMLDAQNAEDAREDTLIKQQELIEAPKRAAEQQSMVQSIVQQMVAPMAQEIMAMVRAELDKPKTLHYGPDGLVAGVNDRRVVRAPDGRIVGLQ